MDAESSYYLCSVENDGSKRYLTVKDNATTSGAAVVQGAFAGSSAQKFKLIRNEGLFKIASTSSATSLVLEAAGSPSNAWYVQKTASAATSQYFTVVGNAKKGHVIRAVDSNLVVTRGKNDELRPRVFNESTTQRWFFEKA